MYTISIRLSHTPDQPAGTLSGVGVYVLPATWASHPCPDWRRQQIDAIITRRLELGRVIEHLNFLYSIRQHTFTKGYRPTAREADEEDYNRTPIATCTVDTWTPTGGIHYHGADGVDMDDMLAAGVM